MSQNNSLTGRLAAGRTVFDFVYEILSKLWEGPIRYWLGFYQKGSAVRELKEKLGEWAIEARDRRGRWRQPVLTKEAFKRHLAKENGHFQPSGECTASFGWAKLLFALNIRPKQGKDSGIISWRVMPDGGASPGQTGTVSLAIDGAALCHIINLYQNYTGNSTVGTFQFSFGKLTLLDENKHSYTFESLGDVELSSQRHPFPYSMRTRNGIQEGYLKFGSSVVISSYLEALEYGINEASVKLSDTDKTLPERVKLLLEGMNMVNQRDWDKSYLITPSWIEYASRIKRRATTNDGKDKLLLHHIRTFISNDKDMEENLKSQLRDEDTWKDLLLSTLKTLFMFHDDKYEFIWNLSIELSSRENVLFVETVKNQLLRALEGLHETDEGKLWARTVSPQVPADDLCKVLNTPHKILNRPVIVLQHMPDEWDFLGDISG